VSLDGDGPGRSGRIRRFRRPDRREPDVCRYRLADLVEQVAPEIPLRIDATDDLYLLLHGVLARLQRPDELYRRRVADGVGDLLFDPQPEGLLMGTHPPVAESGQPDHEQAGSDSAENADIAAQRRHRRQFEASECLALAAGRRRPWREVDLDEHRRPLRRRTEGEPD